jgi:hypothetical protein
VAFPVEILCRWPSNLSAPVPCGCWRGSRAGGRDPHRMLVLGDEQHLIDIDVSAGKRNRRSRQ